MTLVHQSFSLFTRSRGLLLFGQISEVDIFISLVTGECSTERERVGGEKKRERS